MDNEQIDWSERMHYIAITLVQLASIFVILEHFDIDVWKGLRDAKERYKRWLRTQEFELFYRAVWPVRKHDEHRIEPD